MSIPPIPTSAFVSGGRKNLVPRRLGTADRLALISAAVLGVLSLALWQVPPMLDWSGYKGAIAAYAGVRLGRTVTIDGHVGLSLLPRAMLTADGVTLADRGDGISAKLGTMRLEVSLGALMAGAVVPRTLALDAPSAFLPWPLPRGAATHGRPPVAAEFSASLMGGTLRLGGVTFHDIAASLHTDPDSGAFSARGSMMAAALPWRFAAQVGAPGADGASPITLTLDGEAPYGKRRVIAGLLGTGGAFRGRILADGTVTGALVLQGPDLSVLGPAPAVPWRVQGDVRGDGITLRAPALQVTLGEAAGSAAGTLGLGAKLALSLRVALDHIALGHWAWALMTETPAMASHLPADLDVKAGSAVLNGEVIRAPHLALSLTGAGALVRTASAGLPGGAQLAFAGQVQPGAGLTGRVHVQAPDARRTLDWLTQGESGILPDAVMRQGEIDAMIGITRTMVSLRDVAGLIDHSCVSGSMEWGFGPRLSISVDGVTDRLDLAAWAPALWRPDGMPRLGGPFHSSLRAKVHVRLRAGHVSTPALPLDGLVLDADDAEGSITLREAAAEAAGGRINLSGSVRNDGTITGGKAEFTASDAALLPAAWRVPDTLWHGPLHLALSADGPPTDTKAVLRADMGDLRAEAEAHIDRTAPRITATATLRHPGAPRLMADLGAPGADAWLGHGSLALLTHFAATAGHVQVNDFSIAAAAFKASGALDADLSHAAPFVTGTIDASSLALPAIAQDDNTAPRWDIIRRFDADIALRSATMLIALQPAASGLSARLMLGGGVAALHDVTGDVAHGQILGEAVLDASQSPPVAAARFHVAHAAWPMPEGYAAPGVAAYAGSVDANGDFTARGDNRAALLRTAVGAVSGAVTNVSVAGVDLQKLDTALAAGGLHVKNAVSAAFRNGYTTGLSGDFAARLDVGTLIIPRLALRGEAGSLNVAGTMDMAAGKLMMHAAIVPGTPTSPGVIAADLAGVWPAIAATVRRQPGAATHKHKSSNQPESSSSVRTNHRQS